MIDKYIKNKVLKNILEGIYVILLTLVFYFFIQTFLFKTAYIKGVSMEPTLTHADRVLITRFAYFISSPRYNDVVAFPYKENKKDHYIKRIIGLPGDVIDIIDGKFHINGVLLEQEFAEINLSDFGNIKYPFTVPEKLYFVLGDNRNQSHDSRNQQVGCMAKKDFLGKVSVRIWPLNKIGLVK